MVYFVSIALVLVLFYLAQDYLDLGMIFSALLVSLFIAIFPTLIIGAVKKNNMTTHEAPTEIYTVRALNTHRDIEGSFQSAFFVGSVYIQQDLYYYFYIDTSKGVLFNKVPANSVYLIEREGKPQYIKYEEFYDDEYKGTPFYSEYSLGQTRKVLYIPKGTIISNFNVDLE